MKKLSFSPTGIGFFLVLAIKISLILSFLPPSSVFSGYVAFVNGFVENPSLSAWQDWTAAGGEAQAFPYGFAQLFVFVPIFLISKILGLANFGSFAYLLTLLLVDLAIYGLLRSIYRAEHSKVFLIYWASPISIVAIYLLGFNDAISVFFLVASVWAVSKSKFRFAGVAIALAISAKASMLLALPVFAIFFFRNPNARKHLGAFLFGAAACGSVFIGSFIALNPSGIEAILTNPEATKVLESSVNLGVDVYLVPMGYLLVVLGLWKVRRVNFDLFQMSLGLVFLVVVLLTQASPGWYFWLLPLLMAVNFNRNRTNAALTFMFSLCFALTFFPFEVLGNHPVALFANDIAHKYGHTVLFAIGTLIAVSIWRDSIKENDYFRFSRKPFAIGIAGDSGVGKDTLSSAIARLFGVRSTSHLSGDDYHRWERGESAWKNTTHLNPAANEISQFEQDALLLLRGQRVEVVNYDHGSGKKTDLKIVKPNDFVVISGLHALYSPVMRDQLDLKIFMEMEVELRTFLKLRRDVGDRGHNANSVMDSIRNRQPDAQKFINPQRDHADLIFKLEPKGVIDQENFDASSNFDWVLQVESRLGLDEVAIGRALAKSSTTKIEILESEGQAISRMRFVGELSSTEVHAAATSLAPGLAEFLDEDASWSDGPTGLMQLIVLLQLDQLLSKRALA